MYKRLVRSAFIQGHGSNYRRLTKEEKKIAESNFFESLKSQQSSFSFNKIRNFSSFFKELISEARIPVAKQVHSEFTIHEDKYIDNYSWMEDPKNSQELTEYLTFEFNYTEAVLSSKWFLGKDLFNELKNRVPEYKTQVVSKAGFVYFMQDEQLLRKQGDKEEVVLTKESLKDHLVVKNMKETVRFMEENPFSLINLQFSHDHRFIAATFPTENSNLLVVKDMTSGMTGFLAQDVDPFTVFDHAYGLFYVEKDKDTGKGRKVFRMDFAREKSEEEKILEQTRVSIAELALNDSELVFEEKDRTFSCEVLQSLSGDYVFIKSDNLSFDPQRIATEFRFRASNRTEGDFLIIQERKEGVNYDVKHQSNYFYLLVSTPEEYNGKILKLEIPPYQLYTPPSEPLIESSSKDLQHSFLGAKPHLSHSPSTYIEHIEAFRDHLVSILIDCSTSLQHIQVDTFSTSTTDIVSYDKYEGSLKVANSKSYRLKLDQGCQDFNSNSFSYILSTLHSPDQLISYNLDTRLNTLLSHNYDIPGVRVQDYTSERIVLPANDGEMIPITLVYNKKLVKTGNQAAGIVESYGGDIENSHNYQLNPAWYSVMDRGFLWIIPHVRGSFDVNRVWYDRGIGLGKIRHFQDLLDVIVSLFSEKIINLASGYAACPSGGLAFASLLMKEPELLSSVVLRNPLLDVFEFVKAKRMMSEFGDIGDEQVYRCIRSYNPYYQRFPNDFSPLLICADYDHELAFQTIKFLAKSRENRERKTSATVLYKEYPTWTSEEVKRTDEFSFLMENTKVRGKIK